MVKARVSGEELGKRNRRVPRGLRGRHVAKDHQRKLRTSGGSPRHRRTCTAKASCISRIAAKSRCARNWGGWGRLSVDGPGQHNPARSEDPWGKSDESHSNGSAQAHHWPDTERDIHTGGKRWVRRREANQRGRDNWAPLTGRHLLTGQP